MMKRNFPFISDQIAFRVSGIGGFIAILSYPVSVSLSQTGLFLALLGWLLYRLALRNNREGPPEHMEKNGTMPFIIPFPLKCAAAIYGIELVSLIWHMFNGDHPLTALRNGFKDEIKDAWLMGGAFWILAYTDRAESRDRVMRWLYFALMILLATGSISIFSKFRLSKIPYHLLHGWEGSSLARFQHHVGTFFDGTPFAVNLYVPIGLMNTHLTYAALLVMGLPFLFFRAIHPFVQSGHRALNKINLFYIFILLLAGFTLLLNDGRSAIFGLGLSISAGLVFFIREKWRKKSLRLLIPVFLALFSFMMLAAVSPRFSQKAEKTFSMLFGEEKHTDYQRIFVWQGTLNIIENNPLIGIGPGRFKEEINRTILDFSRKHPRLWYAYMIIQRGHAHNDAFHLLAVAGPLCLAAYVLFFTGLIYRIFENSARLRDNFWKWGPAALFLAGIFQCYFQDDEVLLPFWLYTGLALQRRKK